MRSQDSRGGSGRRSGRGQRRSSSRSHDRNDRNDDRAPQRPPVQKSFWQKLISFFKSDAKPAGNGSRPAYPPYQGGSGNGNGRSENQPARKIELLDVTTPKLYIGNLSFSATETDLEELFNGVGIVRSAEIATHRDTDKSKGFGFVSMSTVDEAKRAVTELHDKAFMGRKLVVSGAKAERETDYRG